MRLTKSATSSSLNAFCKDSIGTACRTLAKPRDGAAPTLRDRLSRVRRSGNALLDRLVAPPQRVIFGVRNRRRVLLVVALVVPLDLGFKPRVLALGLAGRHVVDGKLGIAGWSGRFHRPGHSMTRGEAASRLKSSGSGPTLQAGWISRSLDPRFLERLR